MSNFKRRATYTPPFAGTIEEEIDNFNTHDFVPKVTVWMGYTIDVEQCTKCKIGSPNELAKYPCGQAPEKVGWWEYCELMIAAGRENEIP